MGDGGSGVELHHRLVDDTSLFYMLTANDKGNLQFGERLASVSLIDATMVCSDDDNCVIIDASILQSLHKSPYLNVESCQGFVVLRRIVPIRVPRVVKLVPTNSQQRWLLLNDKTFCHLAESFAVVLPVNSQVEVVDSH